MILALLTEVITFYMQITMVKIGIPRLEKSIRLISSACWMVLGLFDTSLYELSKQHIGGSWF